MMKYWPNSRKACANCDCDSSRRDYGGSGYCCRCYRLVRRIKGVEGRGYRENLKRDYRSFTDEEVEIWRDECIRQLEGRLAWLHGREERYRGNVEGIQIENQLRRILYLVRPKAKYPTHATIIDHNFSKEQLGLIYRLLDAIEEAIPWEGPSRNRAINTLKAWDLIYKHRERRDRPADHDEPRHQ